MNAETPNAEKILLVEDDRNDVELTLAGLAQNELADKVAVVRDGAEALDYLYRRGKYQTRAPGNPFLVLLDNKMPKVSGLQVLKTIKMDENLKTIPVVALTSSRERPDLTAFYQNGINAYVVKPVDFSEFMRAIKQLGIFWAGINKPPPVNEAATLQNDEVVPAGKEEIIDEIAAPHPAFGR
jgi:CheY-like chemotaxis protein